MNEMQAQMPKNGVQLNGLNGFKNGYKPRTGAQTLYEDVMKSAAFLMTRTKHTPEVGIICGSGLGGLADNLTDVEAFDYKDIPNFPISTVPGHAGRLVFGMLGGKCTVCMQGRVHGYEGYPMWKTTLPVRVMKELGVKALIVTNAAGGLNPEYEVGDVMIMKDHINFPGLIGQNPFVGLHDDRLGVRFQPTSDCYDKKMMNLAHKIGNDLGFNYLREGVYVIQIGPAFESVAECRMLRMLGADVTGMSTVPEVLVAKHCGMRVFGLTLVTNKCVADYDTGEHANHEEVLETGRMRAKDMQKLVSKLVEGMTV